MRLDRGIPVLNHRAGLHDSIPGTNFDLIGLQERTLTALSLLPYRRAETYSEPPPKRLAFVFPVRGSEAEIVASFSVYATRRSLARPGWKSERRGSHSSSRVCAKTPRPHLCRCTHRVRVSAGLGRHWLVFSVNAGLGHNGRRVGLLSAVMWKRDHGLGWEKSGNLRMPPSLCSSVHRR